LQHKHNSFAKGLFKAVPDNVKYKVWGCELKSFKLYLNAQASLLSTKPRNSCRSLIKEAKKSYKTKLHLRL